MRKETLLFGIIAVVAVIVIIAIIVFYRKQKKIEEKTKAEDRKMYQDLKPSENIKKFIKCYERYGNDGKPAFSIFKNPQGNYEVGWGHDFKANGERVTSSMLSKNYTIDELNALFEKDLQNAHKKGLLHFQNIYMTQEMYDALISYMYNTAYPKKVCSLLKSGADYETVAAEWMNDWTYEKNGGNYFRRLAEKDLFLNKKYVVYKQSSGTNYVSIDISEVKY
ncbi:MAG: hypothetical protein MJ198_05055 [Bacteroidales bacterium]|nr:hypothetical protein [Bacteroidales bacterium]